VIEVRVLLNMPNTRGNVARMVRLWLKLALRTFGAKVVAVTWTDNE